MKIHARIGEGKSTMIGTAIQLVLAGLIGLVGTVLGGLLVWQLTRGPNADARVRRLLGVSWLVVRLALEIGCVLFSMWALYTFLTDTGPIKRIHVVFIPVHLFNLCAYLLIIAVELTPKKQKPTPATARALEGVGSKKKK